MAPAKPRRRSWIDINVNVSAALPELINLPMFDKDNVGAYEALQKEIDSFPLECANKERF